MLIRQNQLPQQLESKLLPLYLVSGDDPFLHQQSCDQIIQAAKKHHFTEKKIFHLDTSFDWNTFASEFGNLSLFGDKTLIELRMKKPSFDRAGSNHIKDIVSILNNDHCLLINMPKLSASNKRSSWYKHLEQSGAIIQIWPLNMQQMLSWLQTFAKKQHLELSADAAQLICEKNQGNLLAASQEIEKLSLQHPKNTFINTHNIEDALQQNSHFSVFDLNHMFLSKNSIQARLILNTLRQEGCEPSIILWGLIRDLRTLQQCHAAVSNSQSLQSVFKQQYLPEKQKLLFSQASKNFSNSQIKRLFKHALEIDKAIKGLSQQNSWLLLERFICE